MRIGIIGGFNSKTLKTNIRFDSRSSLLDYDVIIIDINHIFHIYEGRESIYETTKIMNSITYYKARIDINDRKREIEELMSAGKTIVVFISGPLAFKNELNNKIIYLSELFPIFPHTISSEGNRLEFIGNGIFQNLWTDFKSSFKYSAYFKEKIGEPIFKIKDSSNYVGTHMKYQEGHIIVLPKPTPEADGNLSSEFFSEMSNIIKKLTLKENKITLPEWTKKYYLPNEKEIESRVSQLNQELKNIENELSLKKAEVEELKTFKFLISGTGTLLEDKVGEVFSYMGFSVREGEKGRDDLIIEYDNKIAVVEVKGVSKSAAEKNAAQLEKWVMQYLEINEVKPKGILVVNSYKDIPLEERDSEDFPNQMLKMSVQREHCLISGAQLLSIYIICLNQPSRKKELIDSLFNTIGVYEYINWKENLTLT